MRRTQQVLLPLLLLAALCASLIGNLVLRDDSFTSIAAIADAGSGSCIVACYSGSDIRLQRLDAKGIVRGSCVSRAKNGTDAAAADLAVDSAGRVYLLKDYYDSESGAWLSQELEIYDFDRLLFKRIQCYDLSNEDGVRYAWLSAGTTLSLSGTADGNTLVRSVYDTDSAVQGPLVLKASHSYPIAADDGIWQALPAGGDMAYISNSGKVFVTAEEGKAVEVYPARELTSVMYALYACPLDGDSIYLGEQESGDLLTLKLATGETTALHKGSEPFAGASSYTPADVCRMSMRSETDFAAVVINSTTNRPEILLTEGDAVRSISAAKRSAPAAVAGILLDAVIWFAGLMLAAAALRALAALVGRGHTMLARLGAIAVPVLVAGLALLGVLSYRTYAASVRQSFEKQVVDEGDMLTALFGTESFDEIEYPYDYTGQAYNYLSAQMATRTHYTRAAYYERETLFTGVDASAPCFYPFGIYMDGSLNALYQQAAYSGTAQTGTVRDAHGRRLVCVTPIGGRSGSTVYLLETSVPLGSIEAYTTAYLRSYLLAAAVFLAGMSAALLLAFRRMLRPLARIRDGLEQFAQGNRTVRLEPDTSDELSDIIRVFNKMAGEIDAKLYSLRKTSENYYRFVPQRAFGLLSRGDLGELALGSGVSGRFDVVCVSLALSARLPQEDMEALTNRFFAILDKCCSESGAALLQDRINLRSYKLLCPEGTGAVDLALAVLTQVDAVNAAVPMQARLDPLLIVHRCEVRYCICGDAERLVPTLLAEEIDWLTARQEAIRGLSSRLVVTAAAYAGIDASRYFHRFIGTPNDSGANADVFGLYDFYGSGTSEEIRLIGEGLPTFDKAMELYGARRWYDAKNLFALVLRENPRDNVARYYVFSCEQKLPA